MQIQDHWTTVNGDRVHLKVRPEVSTLDFTNAVLLQGFRIPALTTRRTETELELANGQTFAIAGLLNNTMNETLSKVPGIGDIPILGYLFRSKAAQKNETELVVMITPEILPNRSSGVTPNLPRMPQPFLNPVPEQDLREVPPPAFTPNRQQYTPPAPARSTAVAPAPNSAAAAAAALSSLKPLAPRVIETPLSGPIVAPVPAPVAGRPLSASEQAVLDQAKREEQARAPLSNEASASATTESHSTGTTEEKKTESADEQKKEEDKKQQETADQARNEARRAEEVAAKLRAAEAAYQAELEKQATP